MATLLGGARAAAAAPPAAPSLPTAPAPSSDDAPVPGAQALEGKLIAPCCWMQTVDIHDSPIALELRGEVRRRLRAGESEDAILASMVSRYGERVLAVPPGNPLKTTAVILALVFGAAGVGAGGLLVRWRRRARAAESAAEAAPATPATRDALDDRIDDELGTM
ncbi:MAG: cytochrome c-type biogenesis protein CcmH [Polyangiaceae bacterium]|nr:cytochrome c-type biogenesis protein CcmH [Polyangiaceae bacterium]